MINLGYSQYKLRYIKLLYWNYYRKMKSQDICPIQNDKDVCKRLYHIHILAFRNICACNWMMHVYIYAFLFFPSFFPLWGIYIHLSIFTLFTHSNIICCDVVVSSWHTFIELPCDHVRIMLHPVSMSMFPLPDTAPTSHKDFFKDIHMHDQSINQLWPWQNVRGWWNSIWKVALSLWD